MGKYKIVKSKTTVKAAISDFYSEIESLRDELEDWKSNMEGTPLENTDKYSMLEDAVSTLENIQERDIPEELIDEEIEVSESVPKSKRQAPSRATRASNAEASLRAAMDSIENQSEKLDKEIEELPEDKQEEISKKEELRDELDAVLTELGDDADNLVGIEFPGMY